MAGTISSTITSAYTLVVNPTTILSTGAVLVTASNSAAVTGAAGTVWTLINQGQIENAGSSFGAFGVLLASGGSVSNATSGTITSNYSAVYIDGGNGAVMNDGLIVAAHYDNGVKVKGGSGTVTNTGTISSNYFGVYLTGGGTVTNSGTISGTHDAVRFSAGYTNLLVIDPGAAFVGGVNGGNTIGATAVSTLELASGASIGTISGLGSQFANFAQATLDPSAAWILAGTNTIVAGATLTQGGSGATSATLTDSGTLTNAGDINGMLRLTTGASLINLSSGTIVNAKSFALIDNSSPLPIVDNSGVISSGHYATDFTQGVQLTNRAGGTIFSSAYSAVLVQGGSGTIQNLGSIEVGTAKYPGAFPAIALNSGGYISNASSGTISAVNTPGIRIKSAAGTIVNAGLVQSTISAVIDMAAGGTITNLPTGTLASGIHLGYGGIYIKHNAGTITNFGLITAPSGKAVGFLAGGQLSNEAGGTITASSYGVVVTGGAGTVTNAGIISAGTDAVRLAAGYANRLIDDPGAVFAGTVDGGNTIGSTSISTLELASAASAGTLTSIGTKYIDFGALTIDPGADWVLAGSNVLNGAQLVAPAGSTLGVTGTLVGDVTLQNGAYLGVAAGATIEGSGAFAVQGYGGTGTVVNAGVIDPVYGGVYLATGGAVTNFAGGTIVGNTMGVLVGSGASLVNSGHISAGVYGVVVRGGATAFNNSGGTITGGADGVYLRFGPGTLTNAGTISGGTNAIRFTPGFSNRLVVDPGAVFAGLVDAGDTIGSTLISTLELASAASAGTLSGLGTQFVDFTDVAIDTGASWTLVGSNTVTANAVDLATGASLANAGTLSRAAGVLIYSSAPGVSVTNTGIVLENAGTNSAISLHDGGGASNAATATITGWRGVYFSGASGTLLNAGLITANGTTLGSGVVLEAAGFVSNAATGTIISTYSAGIYVTGGAGTVINAGSIANYSSTGVGIELKTGGYIDNAATGRITSAQRTPVYITGSAGTVVNAGFIHSGGNHTAVVLEVGGSITNQLGGTISGGPAHSGIYVTGSFGTVINAGLLIGGSASGVHLHHGGSITNDATGTITSGATNHSSVYTTGASTGIVNAGVIHGIFAGAGGAVTNQTGGIIAGDLATGVFITGGPGTVINAGTITGVGTHTAIGLPGGFADRLIVDPGATFSGGVFGGNIIGSTIVSTLELASAASTGTLTELGATINNFGSIVFDAGAEWFLSGNTSGLAGIISGFSPGDTIELTGFTATGSSFSGGVLTLPGSPAPATLSLTGSFTTSQFIVTDVAAGTDISLACFRAGTRIRTPRGDVPVEYLHLGDDVTTLLGAASIIWIGHRSIDCRRHPAPLNVWPVRIAKDAFGAGLPCRDLFLSPDHAIFVDDVLIPVKHLINGTTITQTPVGRVAYYHVELAHHAVLLAEGLPAESYLDTGHRTDLAAGNVIALHPDLASRTWEAAGCAPLVVAGPKLAAVRARLEARATGFCVAQAS